MIGQDNQLAVAELRRRAEALARWEAARTPENLEALSPAAARQALHELRVHQIELELQNEELRRTQVELEASRARYFNLYDLAPVGYVTLSEKGLILEANLMAAELLGVERSALVRQPLTHFILPADQDIYYRHRKQLSETGAPQTCELRMRPADSAPFWAQLEMTADERASAATDERTSSAPVGRIVISAITARKQAEVALREAHQRLEATLSALPDAMLEVDAEGRIYDCRTPHPDLLPQPPGALVGQKVGEAWPEAAAGIIAEALARAARRGWSRGATYALEKAGQVRWFELSIVAKSMAGTPAEQRFMVLARNVTDRKTAEAALLTSEARFRGLFEYSPTCLWEEDFSAVKAWLEDLRQQGVVDFEAYFASHPEMVEAGLRRIKVLDVNQAAVKLYGAQSKGELLNRAGQVFGPETRQMITEELLSIARGEREFETVGVDYKLTGERLDVILRRFIPSVHEQTLSQVIVSLADITARKQAEDAVRQLNAELEQRVEARTVELREANRQLVQALRIKDEFLAAMSHELRTPLAAILGLAELLQMHTAGPLTEKQAYYAQTIYQSGQHLLTLITDVLDLTKLAAGQTQLELAPVDLSETCQAALQRAKPQADKKQIAVSLTLDPSVPCLQADARRLKQILVNLLSNAVKFTPAGGQVGLVVSGDEKEHRVEFTVWDTGIGIAAEDLPRLFQNFVQLDARLARNYEGTGLGLALVRHLVELHGGQVQAESDGLGKGSRITVNLPWEVVPAGVAYSSTAASMREQDHDRKQR